MRLVIFGTAANADKEALICGHSRGSEIVKAIVTDLSRDPFTRACELSSGKFFQIYAPNVLPAVVIRTGYLVNKEKILIKVFRWESLCPL